MSSSRTPFRLYLPSNASTDLYPNNSPTCYTTRLKTPIELLDGGKWEVGVESFSYNSNIGDRNEEGTASVNYLVYKVSAKNDDTHPSPYQVLPNYKWNYSTHRLLQVPDIKKKKPDEGANELANVLNATALSLMKNGKLDDDDDDDDDDSDDYEEDDTIPKPGDPGTDITGVLAKNVIDADKSEAQKIIDAENEEMKESAIAQPVKTKRRKPPPTFIYEGRKFGQKQKLDVSGLFKQGKRRKKRATDPPIFTYRTDGNRLIFESPYPTLVLRFNSSLAKLLGYGWEVHTTLGRREKRKDVTTFYKSDMAQQMKDEDYEFSIFDSSVVRKEARIKLKSAKEKPLTGEEFIC